MQKSNYPFKAVPQSHWPLASAAQKCVLCSKSFGLFQVAENCRGCGRVCCSACLADHLVLPGQPGTAPVAVCPLCAKSITRTHEEAEMAVQRCQLLEEILNEQALQAEKLRSDLREQEEEKKLLHHEKERLKATIARMEIEAEVAAAKAKAAEVEAASAAPAAPATPAHSPVASPSKAEAGAGSGPFTQESAAALEEQLMKKKRQLDMREATLKDALKKVSADAARNADQRAAMQEQERQLTALVTSKFTALFEEERRRLEELCTEAVTDLQHQYTAWVAQQQDGALERRRRYEVAMEERLQRAAAELAEARAGRDALQSTVETQKHRLEALEREVESAATAATTSTSELVERQAQSQAALDQRISEWEAERAALESAAAAATRRAESAEAAQRQLRAELEEATARHAAELAARQEALTAYEAEQRRAQARMEAVVSDIRARQAQAEGDAAAAVLAAQQEAAAAHEAECRALRSRLEAQFAADLEEVKQRAQREKEMALQDVDLELMREKETLVNTVTELQQQLQKAEATRQDAPPPPQSEATQTRSSSSQADSSAVDQVRAEHAEAMAQLRATHESEKAELEKSLRALQETVQQLEAQRSAEAAEAAAALARAEQSHADGVAALTAKHQTEKDAWAKKAEEFRRTPSQQQQQQRPDGPQSQAKAWREEKAALQQTCKDLEAKLETRRTASWQLQQQVRDGKQQIAELQAELQKAREGAADTTAAVQSRAATASQRGAALVVKEVQQMHKSLVAEHGAALTQMRAGLLEAAKTAAAAATAREKKARDAVRALQAQVVTLKEEKEGFAARLAEEQVKRKAAEERVEKVKATLQNSQSAVQAHKETIAELQASLRDAAAQLDALRATAAVESSADSVAADSLEEQKRHVSVLCALEQRWLQQQDHTAWLYTSALFAVLQHEFTRILNATAAALAEEAERQRQLSSRNAKALENTTSTIREVQEDLRTRTQALVERQAAVESAERRVADKKRRVDAVCRDLYAVAAELRRKTVDGANGAEVEGIVRSARAMSADA